MIELTKIQKTYKLNLLLKKHNNPIQEEDYVTYPDLKELLKQIQLYIQLRLIIEKFVKKRYKYLKKLNLNQTEFFNYTFFPENVFDIYVQVKFCKYYEDLIKKKWTKSEFLIDYLIKKYNY